MAENQFTLISLFWGENMGLDENYKRAVIKLANKEIPDLTKALNQFCDINHFPVGKDLERLIDAMNNLGRQLNLMPRSVKMRP